MKEPLQYLVNCFQILALAIAFASRSCAPTAVDIYVKISGKQSLSISAHAESANPDIVKLLAQDLGLSHAGLGCGHE
jgi:hypothetical protein